MNLLKTARLLGDELRYGDKRRLLWSTMLPRCNIGEFLKVRGIHLDGREVVTPSIPDDVVKAPLVEYDADFLCILTGALQPQRVFEIGTGLGIASQCFLSNMDDGVVLSMDMQDRYIMAADKRLIKIYADSLQFDFSRWYNQVTLFFIDGDHSYNAVYTDSRNALKCIRDDGYIIWHDFHPDYLGCVAAVIDFIEEYDLDYRKIIGTNMVVAWQ